MDDELTKNVAEKKMGWREFVYRLFFTRDDNLDVLQLLFIVLVLVTLYLCGYIVLSGTNPEIQKDVLVTLRWMVGLLVVTAVPQWLVPFLVKAKTPTDDKTEGESTE